MNALKSLDWDDLLKKSSDNEYDSDETCCDLNDISTKENDIKDVDDNKESVIENKDTHRSSSTVQSEKLVPKSNTTPHLRKLESNIQGPLKSNYPAGKETVETKVVNHQPKTIAYVNNMSDTSFSEEEINYEENITNGCDLPRKVRVQNVKVKAGKPLKHHCKNPKIFLSKKSLPKRNCKSIYINNSLHSKEDVAYESLSETEDIETTKQIVWNLPSTSNSKRNLGKGGENPDKKTFKRRGRKRKDLNPLMDLKGIDSALKVIEDKVERWITGMDGDPPTRQLAFEMLSESQSFIKSLKEYSSRCSTKNDKHTIKLMLKRANIVSSVIDKAIAEADRLMNLEESTDLDLETESQSDTQTSEKRIGDGDLKPILKRNPTVHSEESSESYSKRVSFSDNIQYHYLPNDEGSLGVINNATQEDNSIRQWENTTDCDIHNAKNMIRDTEKQTKSNNGKPGSEEGKRKETTNMNNQYSKHEDSFHSYDSNTENFECEVTCNNIGKFPEKLQTTSPDKPVNNRNSEDLLKKEQTESSLSNSQHNLTDNDESVQSEASIVDVNSFGFSKIGEKADDLAWANLTIMSIKNIVLRGDEELAVISEDSFDAEDFKW